MRRRRWLDRLIRVCLTLVCAGLVSWALLIFSPIGSLVGFVMVALGGIGLLVFDIIPEIWR